MLHQPLTLEQSLCFCRVVGAMLHIDGHVAIEEYAFLESLMADLELSQEDRDRVWIEARTFTRLDEDLELLGRSNLGQQVFEELERAALADRVVKPSEQAMLIRCKAALLRDDVTSSSWTPRAVQRCSISERYELLYQLGQGAHGVVFEAVQRHTGQHVAVKMLEVEIDQMASPKARASIEARFWRDVMIMSQMTNPHCARLIDAGFDIDAPYMVLELIDGATLGRHVKQLEGGMPFEQSCALMRQLLEAITDAHSKGIVHRDLKPGNIMVIGRGTTLTVKVIDFGIAGIMHDFRNTEHVTITIPGESMGTLSYAPREQLTEFALARPQSDVYALGLIFLVCLTGQRPIQLTDTRELLLWQLSDAPVPIPDEVRALPVGPLIERACQKNWALRHASAAEMLSAFDACLGVQSDAATTLSMVVEVT